MYENIKKFSERTGLSYYAVRLMCINGKLPHVCVGSKRMIHVEPALQALEEMTRHGDQK